jgi:hypothetical protein
MTTESQIIKELFPNKKGIKITHWTRSWFIFKKRFLEYLEKTLLDSDLEDAVQLEEFLRTKCDFYYSMNAPVVARKHASYMKDFRGALFYYYCTLLHSSRSLDIRCLDVNGRHNLGLFWKADTRRFQEGEIFTEVCGMLQPIQTEDAATLLKDSGFPSLFSNNTKQHILFGPLSLVNHACNAPFGFYVLPDTLSKDVLPGALKWHKSVALRAKKAFTLETGQEIVANYGDEYKFTNCWCESCRRQHKRN